MLNERSIAGDDCGGDHGYAEMDPSGRYGRFNEVLGKGAMKTVYKAVDEVLGMEVAWSQVKLHDLVRAPEDLQRLYSEVHLLSTLNHDSIIKFYTSWIDVDRRTFNFITEMFTSGTLREYRKKYNRVDILAIKIWARQILSGLVYLHGHDPPVIHRDLKCDNIFVNGHLGQVKIGDLGLAAILYGSSRAHSIIGTPEFMAPELYEENYNELVDVYSFGMSLLEMLTHEYPYSECTNPAQIYKKVTLGKLPRAFYKVQDLEAQRFIGKCLVNASKRLSAKELMLDPFLAIDEDELLPISMSGNQKAFLNDEIEIAKLRLEEYTHRTNMTITGKLNPEDDTIFLKVQIADKEGSVRNVFFPFDILSDTPDDVAAEMVKELEITDWEPSEIANMIDGEISALVPHWEWSQSKADDCHVLNFHDDSQSHPFYYLSPTSSSQTSSSSLIASQFIDGGIRGHNWLQDGLYDDTSSEGSVVSAPYSSLSFKSVEERDLLLSPTKSVNHPLPMAQNSTRFCQDEHAFGTKELNVKAEGPSSSKGSKCLASQPRLSRNSSMVDIRSQLLHRSLLEEVSKRRLFKTAGAVEDVGFQPSLKNTGNDKKQGRKGRRL